ncbi:helix-turn-helix domain-containing protein [Hutsoniella sourekii]
MIRLLGSKDQRQLALIQLYRNNKGAYYTHAELAKKLDCAKGTIGSDLNDIKRLFNEEIEILESGTGISLAFKQELPLNFYFRTFSRQCLNFRLLIDLFEHGDQPIEDVSQRLYVSRSSIYRAMSQINQVLKEVNLNLIGITAPVGLRGDELSIRIAVPFLITHYFSDVEWPFSTISQEEAVALFDLIARNSPYLQLFASNPLVYIQIAINFERYAKGYKLSSQDWTLTNDQLSFLLEGQDPFANYQVQDMQYPLMEVIPQVVVGLINPSPLLDQNLRLENSLELLAQEGISRFKSQLMELQEEFDLKSAKETDFDLIALTIYNLLMAEGYSINIIIDDPIAHQSDLVREIAYINADFVMKIQSLIGCLMDHLEVKVIDQDNVIELLMFYVLVIWPDIIEELNNDQLIDLLVYTGNYNYDLNYKAYLEPLFYHYLRIHVESGVPNWSQILEEDTYQIILSSYYVPPTPNHHVYTIQSMPDIETLTWLYQTIRLINDCDISGLSQPATYRKIHVL